MERTQPYGVAKPGDGSFDHSVIAGALGLTNVSDLAQRISMILFALFFVIFLFLLGFALLVSEAINHASPLPAAVSLVEIS